MQGWIIYNGSIHIKKIDDLIDRLVLKAKEKGVMLTKIANNQILPIFNSKGDLSLEFSIQVSEPDFVIFWDKDILLAQVLENLGYKLFNSSEAIRLCDHKGVMHNFFFKNKLDTPKTIIGSFAFHNQDISHEYCNKAIEILGLPIILKESTGSFGMQVYKLNSELELYDKIMSIKHNDFILQEFIETTTGRDIRVNIVGNKVVGAMLRKNSEDFRANVTLGASTEIYKLSKAEEILALKAHKLLKLDFSGVDLLFGQDGPLLCEVNSNVNFLSFEKITGIDFADIIMSYIIEEMK